MTRTTTYGRAATALLATALLATACSGGGATGGDDSTEPTADATTSAPEPSQTAAPPAEGGSVTLITHDSFNVSEEVLASFEEETGITVELLASGDAGSMLNQVILTKDSPQGDVVFGVDNTFLSRALDEELFAPYASPLLDAVPDRFELDPEHRVTPVDYGDVCLNYDKAWFEDNDLAVPGTLDELTDPAYEGLLVVENPATSSPGLAFLLATVEHFGDGWEQYWADLRDNDVLVSDGWEDAYYGQFSGGSGEGDRPLVVSYASSPPAEVIFADPQPDEAPTGVITASCFRQIEFAGVLAGSEHQAEGQALIDFMLSESFQSDIPLNMFVFPVNEQVALPDAFVEHTSIPDDPFQIDYARIGENREDWIDTWTSTVLR